MSNAANMKRFVYDTFLDYHNESSILALINRDRNIKDINDGNDNSGKTSSGGSKSTSKSGSNNNYDSVYIDVIRAFSRSNDDIDTTTQSRLPPATARKVLNGHQNTNNNNNQNTASNCKSMKIQDKYSKALLTLYFNSYLVNMILPTLRSEPFEPTTSTTTSAAVTSDGSITGDISSSTNPTTNATHIAVPSTAHALMNAAQRGNVNKITGSTFYDM